MVDQVWQRRTMNGRQMQIAVRQTEARKFSIHIEDETTAEMWFNVFDTHKILLINQNLHNKFQANEDFIDFIQNAIYKPSPHVHVNFISRPVVANGRNSEDGCDNHIEANSNVQAALDGDDEICEHGRNSAAYISERVEAAPRITASSTLQKQLQHQRPSTPINKPWSMKPLGTSSKDNRHRKMLVVESHSEYAAEQYFLPLIHLGKKVWGKRQSVSHHRTSTSTPRGGSSDDVSCRTGFHPAVSARRLSSESSKHRMEQMEEKNRYLIEKLSHARNEIYTLKTVLLRFQTRRQTINQIRMAHSDDSPYRKFKLTQDEPDRDQQQLQRLNTVNNYAHRLTHQISTDDPEIPQRTRMKCSDPYDDKDYDHRLQENPEKLMFDSYNNSSNNNNNETGRETDVGINNGPSKKSLAEHRTNLRSRRNGGPWRTKAGSGPSDIRRKSHYQTAALAVRYNKNDHANKKRYSDQRRQLPFSNQRYLQLHQIPSTKRPMRPAVASSRDMKHSASGGFFDKHILHPVSKVDCARQMHGGHGCMKDVNDNAIWDQIMQTRYRQADSVAQLPQKPLHQLPQYIYDSAYPHRHNKGERQTNATSVLPQEHQQHYRHRQRFQNTMSNYTQPAKTVGVGGKTYRQRHVTAYEAVAQQKTGYPAADNLPPPSNVVNKTCVSCDTAEEFLDSRVTSRDEPIRLIWRNENYG